MENETSAMIAHKEAYRYFMQEHAQIDAANAAIGPEKAGFMAVADLALDSGWAALESTGMRHCDIARFRFLVHENSSKDRG